MGIINLLNNSNKVSTLDTGVSAVNKNNIKSTGANSKLTSAQFSANSALVKQYGNYSNYLKGTPLTASNSPVDNTLPTINATDDKVFKASTSTIMNRFTNPSSSNGSGITDAVQSALTNARTSAPTIPESNVQNQSNFGTHPGEVAYHEQQMIETPSAPSNEASGEQIPAPFIPYSNEEYERRQNQPVTTAEGVVLDGNPINAETLGSEAMNNFEMHKALGNATPNVDNGADGGATSSSNAVMSEEQFAQSTNTPEQNAYIPLATGEITLKSLEQQRQALNDEFMGNNKNLFTANESNLMPNKEVQAYQIAASKDTDPSDTVQPVTNPTASDNTVPSTTPTYRPITKYDKIADIEPAVTSPRVEDAYSDFVENNNSEKATEEASNVPPVENTVTPQPQPQPQPQSDKEEALNNLNNFNNITTPEAIKNITNSTQLDIANEQFKDSTGMSTEVFDKVIDYLGNQKASGTAMAENIRNLMTSLSQEQRDLLYSLAAKKRELAEQTAKNLRTRAAADANTQYALNQATYGRQAEQLASMGLGTSGYSDYLTSQAYAANRSGIQNANVESEKAIQDALNAEYDSQMSAESAYKNAIANANKEYETSIYDINSANDKGVLNAYLDKLTADADARKNLRNDYVNAYEAELARAEAEAKKNESNALANQQTAQSQFSNLDTIRQQFNSEGAMRYTLSDLDQMASLGLLTAEGAETLKSEQSSLVLEDLTDMINSGGIDDVSAWKKRLGDMKGKYLTDDAYSQAMDILNKISGTRTFSTNRFSISNVSPDGSFTIQNGAGKYSLAKGKNVEDGATITALNNLSNGANLSDNALIWRNGKLYIKDGQSWAEVGGDIQRFVTSF